MTTKPEPNNNRFQQRNPMTTKSEPNNETQRPRNLTSTKPNVHETQRPRNPPTTNNEPTDHETRRPRNPTTTKPNDNQYRLSPGSYASGASYLPFAEHWTPKMSDIFTLTIDCKMGDDRTLVVLTSEKKRIGLP